MALGEWKEWQYKFVAKLIKKNYNIYAEFYLKMKIYFQKISGTIPIKERAKANRKTIF